MKDILKYKMDIIQKKKKWKQAIGNPKFIGNDNIGILKVSFLGLLIILAKSAFAFHILRIQ